MLIKISIYLGITLINFNINYSFKALSSSTKPIAAPHDKDSTACMINTGVGVAAASTASPSHSLSPENVIVQII